MYTYIYIYIYIYSICEFVTSTFEIFCRQVYGDTDDVC